MMFLLAGFNPRGRLVCWAFVRAGDGAPRWTRLWRFRCGEMAWIGRRFGFAIRNASVVCSLFEPHAAYRTIFGGPMKNICDIEYDKPSAEIMHG